MLYDGVVAPITTVVAENLALYVFGYDAVLAPKGWICTDTSRSSTSETQLVVHPKEANQHKYGIYSKWITNATIWDQGYVFSWASVYFPKFVPTEYKTKSNTFKDQSSNNGISKYSTDKLNYDSQFLMEYFTPSFTRGIGLDILIDPVDSTERYPVQDSPIRGFVAVGNSGKNQACTIFLYAEIMPPEYAAFVSYMTTENKSVVQSLIKTGQTC